MALASCILVLTNERRLHRLFRFMLAVPANRIERGSPDVSSEYNLQDDNRVFLLALFRQVHCSLTTAYGIPFSPRYRSNDKGTHPNTIPAKRPTTS